MNYSSHARAGLIFSTLTALAYFLIKNDFRNAVFAGLLAFIGAVFPDLDTDSKPSRYAARAGLIFSVLCLLAAKPMPAAIVGALFMLFKCDKHRGFLHKYWFPAAFLGVSIWSGNFLYAAFAAGLVCHFWVDGISPLRRNNLY